MISHRVSHTRVDRHPAPLLKEVERTGPHDYHDPRTGFDYSVIWDGAGPLPGQEAWPSRRIAPVWPDTSVRQKGSRT